MVITKKVINNHSPGTIRRQSGSYNKPSWSMDLTDKSSPIQVVETYIT